MVTTNILLVFNQKLQLYGIVLKNDTIPFNMCKIILFNFFWKNLRKLVFFINCCGRQGKVLQINAKKHIIKKKTVIAGAWI